MRAKDPASSGATQLIAMLWAHFEPPVVVPIFLAIALAGITYALK